MTNGYRRSCSAARAVHPHEFGAGDAGQAVRVLVAQIVLGGEGDAGQVGQIAHCVGRCSGLGETFGVKGGFHCLLNRRPQTNGLRRLNCGPVPRFRFVEKVHELSPKAT